MQNSQYAAQKLWDDSNQTSIPDSETPFDSIDDAQRRATMVFDLLLTVLTCPNGPSLSGSLSK